jgi:hypothetical protein
VIVEIEGYALRQDALLYRAERDLAVERGKQGRATKADVNSANARFEQARRRFCEFVKKAQ